MEKHFSVSDLRMPHRLKVSCHDISAACYYLYKHLKSTTNHDESGCHAPSNADSVAGHMSHTTPTAIDRSSPVHLIMAGKPRNEG